jgi:hypothetical protein
MFTFLGDAAPAGLGGWCSYFRCIWRLSKKDLQFLGFPMIIFDENTEVYPLDALHINILEFLTLIIDVWFALVFAIVRTRIVPSTALVSFWATTPPLFLEWRMRVE